MTTPLPYHMNQLRIVFMGTPPLAATVLEAVLAQKAFEVIAVVTQPDQPKGRELKLQPSSQGTRAEDESAGAATRTRS